MYKTSLSITALILLALTITFTGCSKQPKPSSFTFSSQKKIQAAHHWEILVNDLAKEIEMSKQLAGKIKSPLALIPNDNSQFTKAFRSFLTTHFINSGVTLNDSASETKLDWSVQLIKHKANRQADEYPGLHTVAYALGYGVYKIWDKNGATEGLLASAVAVDLANQLFYINKIDVPHSEIIINITLLDSNNNMVYRKSNVYYINDLDQSHYSFSPDIPYKEAKTKHFIVTD